MLSNVTKMCYRKIKANQVQEKIWKEVVIVTDLTDQGVRITDQAYTKTTLIDPENLVAAGLNDLPDKPGKLIAIKDAFTIFVTDKVSGVEKPIFKYVVDYEDYEGKTLENTSKFRIDIIKQFPTQSFYQCVIIYHKPLLNFGAQEVYDFRKPCV